jgi:hypothetical protein
MMKQDVINSAKVSALTALMLAAGTFCISLVRPGIDLLFGEKAQFHWLFAAKTSLAISAIWFGLYFVWSLILAFRSRPVYDILDKNPLEGNLLKKPMVGFVAMEYFWLILNRTYIVFVAPEGVYGWKIFGPVTNSNRTFYEPFQEMLDEEFLRDKESITQLSHLAGGFFLDRSSIASISDDPRQKWGMGGILHSGRLSVRLNNGKSREFILLGCVDQDAICSGAAASLGIQVTSSK